MNQDLRRKIKRVKKVLLNEQGQLSIFVALIFQVIFVFFAMMINIGLVVHDKINLQNAVDLAAYYGAERQAEILNEMAHVNYQIRQDYKLLAWRYRVMGTLGRQGSNAPTDQTLPPARKGNPGGLTDKAWVNPAYGAGELPSVCVASDQWSDMLINSTQDENYCFNPYGQGTPAIPSLPTIAPFVPGLAESQAFTQLAQQQQLVSCQRAGPLNWAFAAQIYFAYKLAVASRKELFWAMRENIILDDPKDLTNSSVQAGVEATFKHNLTEGNTNGSPQLQQLNGLANSNCNIGDKGEFEFPEIETAPTLLYTNYNCDTDGSAFQVTFDNMAKLDQQYVQQWDPQGLLKLMTQGEPGSSSPLQSSLGFEKNPWCMAWWGVKAQTSVRKPFMPFGNPIQIQAQAYAQPFGGRIGPWYRDSWSHGSPTSSGGNRVDPLTSPRYLDGSLDGTGAQRLPNYSRYPGDSKLGVNSEITLGAQNTTIRLYANNPQKANRFYLKYYANFNPIPTTGDVLAVDPTGALRKAEISAISPDLFDTIYYSVDPNYYQAFAQTTASQYQDLPQIFGQQVKQLADIGTSTTLPGFNVTFQINTAVGGTGGGGSLDPAVLGNLYYVIRDWRHLLTGWVQNGIVDFSFPTGRYGQCATPASPLLPIPSNCWMGGGRVGYSVRLISKSALTFGGWQIGGADGSTGGILNPPTSF